jgi:hypothetical protein
MKRKTVKTYLDGFGTVRSVLQLDALTAKEIIDALDPDRKDPLLTPGSAATTQLSARPGVAEPRGSRRRS